MTEVYRYNQRLTVGKYAKIVQVHNYISNTLCKFSRNIIAY